MSRYWRLPLLDDDDELIKGNLFKMKMEAASTRLYRASPTVISTYRTGESKKYFFNNVKLNFRVPIYTYKRKPNYHNYIKHNSPFA